MKGIFFTIITFIIFLSFVTYISVMMNSNIEKSNLITERISAERIFYTWRAIADNIEITMNVNVTEYDNVTEIKDFLCSKCSKDYIDDILEEYGEFIDQYFKDKTIDICFECPACTCSDPSEMESKIIIKPMNINYSWPDFAKHELYIRANPSNFSFIKKIEMFLFVTPPIKDDISKIDWSPFSRCNPGESYCLNMDLTVTDGTKTWISLEHYFKVESPQKSTVKIGLGGEPAADFWIRISVGSLPDVVHVDMQNANVTSDTKIQLNTSDFYINLASILNVSTIFGKKVDYL